MKSEDAENEKVDAVDPIGRRRKAQIKKNRAEDTKKKKQDKTKKKKKTQKDETNDFLREKYLKEYINWHRANHRFYENFESDLSR